MFTEMKKRPYKMQKRERGRERTRQKIVEAAVDLHGSVGPKNTSISALAERAGVQRLTVYRHFPDEQALFHACSSHWFGQHPPPDSENWLESTDPTERTSVALLSLYRYYRQTASMWTVLYRDVEEVPAIKKPLQAFDEYLKSIRDALLAVWWPKGRKPKPLTATISHAIEFDTWRSLENLGLNDRQMVELVTRWIAAAKTD